MGSQVSAGRGKHAGQGIGRHCSALWRYQLEDMEEHSDFSSPDEDYRLFILIVVSSFIILSLILIIGITSCILICFEDSISDVNTQYKQIQQSLLMYPQGAGAQLYAHQTGAMLYQDLQHHDTADVCRSYEEENRRELYDMG